MFAEIRSACFLAPEFIVARPKIADEFNVYPFGNESRFDFRICEFSLGLSDRFADVIMRNKFPIIIILVYRDKVIFNFYEYSGFLAYLANTAFLKAFVLFKASAGREKLLVFELVANQYFIVFNHKPAARNATPFDFG